MVNIKIKTSFVSPLTLKYFSEINYLPIFIIRNIATSELIGKYSSTAVHFKELAPSNELFRNKRDGLISFEEFKKLYTIEIASGVNLYNVLDRLESLCNLSGANGIVLLGYGGDYNKCHRSVLSDILNKSGMLSEPVREIIF